MNEGQTCLGRSDSDCGMMPRHWPLCNRPRRRGAVGPGSRLPVPWMIRVSAVIMSDHDQSACRRRCAATGAAASSLASSEKYGLARPGAALRMAVGQGPGLAGGPGPARESEPRPTLPPLPPVRCRPTARAPATRTLFDGRA